MREVYRTAVIKNAKALVLLDALCRQPTVSVNNVAQILSCTFPTAAKLVRDFAARGWLHELTGHERNRLWRYQPYLDLFHRDTLDEMGWRAGDATSVHRRRADLDGRICYERSRARRERGQPVANVARRSASSARYRWDRARM